MPREPIHGQGQVHRGLKCAKMADFKVYHLHLYQVIITLLANYDTPRQQCLLNRRIFIFVLTWHRGTFKLRVFRLWQMEFYLLRS